MALLATHIRFALDIRQRFPLDSLGDYCAGAAYPDSRYLTGIRRKQTHFEDSPHDPFADGLTDFERGWAAHNLYDLKAGGHYMNLLPRPKDDLKQFNHVWCYLTALKVVEDIGSYSRFGADLPLLQGLQCDRRPLNEDADKLNRYFDGLKRLYADRPSPQRYGELLRDWGADEQVSSGVLDAVAKIDADAGRKEQVTAIYMKVLQDVVGPDGASEK